MPEIAVEESCPAAGGGGERHGFRRHVAPLGQRVGAAGNERRGVAYLDFNVIHLKYMSLLGSWTSSTFLLAAQASAC